MVNANMLKDVFKKLSVYGDDVVENVAKYGDDVFKPINFIDDSTPYFRKKPLEWATASMVDLSEHSPPVHLLPKKYGTVIAQSDVSPYTVKLPTDRRLNDFNKFKHLSEIDYHIPKTSDYTDVNQINSFLDRLDEKYPISYGYSSAPFKYQEKLKELYKRLDSTPWEVHRDFPFDSEWGYPYRYNNSDTTNELFDTVKSKVRNDITPTQSRLQKYLPENIENASIGYWEDYVNDWDGDFDYEYFDDPIEQSMHDYQDLLNPPAQRMYNTIRKKVDQGFVKIPEHITDPRYKSMYIDDLVRRALEKKS